MSTHNLSRTTIEGGRCGHYKTDVRKRARQERAATREFLRAMKHDPESFEDCSPPLRQPETPCFADKLNPMLRFLESRIGEKWSEVRSELFAKFDTRTTPGRHVLFDHLLREVCESCNLEPDAPERRYKNFFLDAEGRLRKFALPRFQRRRPPRCNCLAVAAWLGSRKIGRCGKHFVWFEPASMHGIREPVYRGVRAVYDGAFIYGVLDENGNVIRDPVPTPSINGRVYAQPPIVRRSQIRFRQARRLNEQEEAFFRSLPTSVQNEILALAPANV